MPLALVLLRRAHVLKARPLAWQSEKRFGTKPSTEGLLSALINQSPLRTERRLAESVRPDLLSLGRRGCIYYFRQDARITTQQITIYFVMYSGKTCPKGSGILVVDYPILCLG